MSYALDIARQSTVDQLQPHCREWRTQSSTQPCRRSNQQRRFNLPSAVRRHLSSRRCRTILSFDLISRQEQNLNVDVDVDVVSSVENDEQARCILINARSICNKIGELNFTIDQFNP